MQLDLTTIDHVANLANLELTQEEKQRLVNEMSQLLGFVDQLNTLNLDDVKAMEGETDSPVLSPIWVDEDVAILRPDKAVQPISREALLSNAPEQENHAFVVPQILGASA